jgi:guanylate kinase
MSSSLTRGLLFVVSAPSGTGKTTVVERLVEVCPRLVRSRSYTSRPGRAGEIDGVDYNFMSRPAFEAMVARDAFLEWADVFGNLYGTARDETERRLAAGDDVVLVIDVQGARQVRTKANDTIGIFVLPPTFAILEHRLRGRSRDTGDAIERRLRTAREEIGAVDEYDYVVVNDDLDRCVTEIAAIVIAERARWPRRRASLEASIASFSRSERGVSDV